MYVGILTHTTDTELLKYKMERYASYGYTAIDYHGYSDPTKAVYDLPENEFEALMRRNGDVIRGAGLFLSQTHAPFRAMRYPLEERVLALTRMKAGIRATAYLECADMVAHPLQPLGKEDGNEAAVWAINAEFYGRMADYAKEYGVNICLENMPFPGQSQASVPNTLRLIHDVGRDNVGFCLDTGHALVTGDDLGEALRLGIKEKRFVLHVHDNDGKIDQHLFPGKGVGNWKKFAQALHDVGFDGSMSLETKVKPENFKDPSPYVIDAAERELFAQAKAIAENKAE